APRRSFRCRPADRDDDGCRCGFRPFVNSGGIEQSRPQAYQFGQGIQRENAMIIDGPDSVTKAVLSEIERAPDPRFREVMTALVKHLHSFIREVRLTEAEFRTAGEYINAIGKNTNDFHNEAVLMSG